MKKLTTLLFIFSFTASFAQKECNRWYFGFGAGLDFTSGSPVVVSGPMPYTSEGCTSVCDASGKLRFFTNGVDVYDSTKTVMPNGSGLTGDISSTQSALVVPNPSSGSKYYIFTTGADGAGTFGFSEVDMTLNGGLGDVITATKNTVKMDSATEKIAAIRDLSNGTWIVTHKWGTNEFYSYHLTTAGLSAPVISAVGSVHNTTQIQNTYGQMKFNNCGTRMACAIGRQDIVELFDFDLSSGTVSNPIQIPMGDHVYGVEFSPNGNLLYATSYNVSCTLAQYNISLATTPLIIASKTPLSVTSDLYGMQMGPDGKIYVSMSYSSSYLAAISNPNVLGSGCNYADNVISLDPSFMGVSGALSLPGFMQTYLKLATGATCLTTDIADVNAEEELPVYPNPSASGFNMELKTLSMITIYDYTGRLIETHNMAGVLKFGEDFTAGIYFVNVITGTKTQTIKIVKQ
ncbi:MAG: T9SS type A sorting domain-containing protein [Bacteroidia bacterium]